MLHAPLKTPLALAVLTLAACGDAAVTNPPATTAASLRTEADRCVAPEARLWLEREPAPVRTRAQLGELSASLRHEVFKLLPAADRAALWRERVRAEIPGSGHDDAKARMLAELLTLLTAEAWEDGSAADAAAAHWEARAQSVFSREELYALGGDLLDDSGEGSPRIVYASTASAACACSTSSDYCAFPGPHTVHCRAGSCTTGGKNCGLFWRHACNGKCALGASEPTPVGSVELHEQLH